MSTTERRTDAIEQTRRIVFARDGYRCVVCGRPATQLGHVIAQSRMNLRRYGAAVIHHPSNMRAVCGLACNHAVELSTKARPVEAETHVQRIREEITRD